jgi:flagellar basal-body rod protein FlgB
MAQGLLGVRPQSESVHIDSAMWRLPSDMRTSAMSDKLFGIHAQALNLRAERAGLLAANLANADTPNFKARDVDFKSVLGAQAGANKVSMRTTDVNHQRPVSLGGFNDVTLKYRIPQQPSLDGNTVDEQVEKSEFSSNAVRYMASLKFLENRVSGIIRTLKGE